MLESIVSIVAVAFCVYVTHQLHSISSRLDENYEQTADLDESVHDALEQLAGLIAEGHVVNAELHHTTHHALLAAPDDRDDLKRLYQDVNPPESQEG